MTSLQRPHTVRSHRESTVRGAVGRRASVGRLAVALVATAGLAACGGPSGGGAAPEGPPESMRERASYGIGHNLGNSMREQGAEVDLDRLVQGLRDGLAGNEPVISAEEIQSAVAELQAEASARRGEMMADEGEANRAEGESFLAENAEREGVVVLPSGLQYEVVEEGDGATPGPADTVTVHYRGTLVDGTQFDSSYDRGEPASFPLDRVVPGFSEGIQQMQVGSHYRLYIPGELGYGASPRPGGPIGPFDTLIFEVELLGIEGQ